MPSPESFARPETTRLVTFRLSETDHAGLITLARRSKLGHSTFVRRIVEHYIEQHAAPRRKGG